MNLKRPTVTVEEIAEVNRSAYQKQGYLVFESYVEVKIGTIVGAAEVFDLIGIDQPFRIVSVATLEERLAQVELKAKLYGREFRSSEAQFAYKLVTE